MEFGENNKVIMCIPYNQELIRKVKTISRRRWNPQGWEVPYSENLTAKLHSLFGENLVIDPCFYLIPLQKELSIRRYSKRTIKSYIKINRDFLLFSGKKLEDIDTNRKLIHIRASKGRKNRYTLLSNVTLQTLWEYWKKEKLQKWLFPSWNKGEAYNCENCSKDFL